MSKQRSNRPPMVTRNFLVPATLWAAAQAEAARRGEYVSEVIRAALRTYTNPKDKS